MDRSPYLTAARPIVFAARCASSSSIVRFYIYELSNAFNSFYHENKILAEEDKAKQAQWIALITLTLRILETCTGLLGFQAPERM